MQLWEYKTQNLEVFVAVSHFYTKFDCPVARQTFSLVATAHDCELAYLSEPYLGVLFIYLPFFIGLFFSSLISLLMLLNKSNTYGLGKDETGLVTVWTYW